MRTRRSRGRRWVTKIATGGTGPAFAELSIRLRLDDGGQVSKCFLNIPKRIAMPEADFRSTVAEQLRHLADQIVGAETEDPLAWPLVQFNARGAKQNSEAGRKSALNERNCPPYSSSSTDRGVRPLQIPTGGGPQIAPGA